MKSQSCWAVLGVGLVLLTAAAGAKEKEPLPQVSPDGLHLQKSSKSGAVYLKPGADFSQYRRVSILECYVEFEKNWQRDYNRSQVSVDGRVTDKDVERMKTQLAAEFKKVFSNELAKNGGYEVVDVAAPDVLLLRPALLNVEVNAPDLMTAGIGATVVRSAGQMTLYLELWDPTTKTILARVLEAREADETFAQPANRVTNTAAAEDLLRRWAGKLRSYLDAVQRPN